MLWTLLSFGIIVIWVAGMMVAAKLADKSGGQDREVTGQLPPGGHQVGRQDQSAPGRYPGPQRAKMRNLP